MKLEITEPVLSLMEKAAARFDLTYAEIIKTALVAYRRGRIALSVSKAAPCDHRRSKSQTHSISIPDLSLSEAINAPLLNEILSHHLTYHLAKPERKEAPLQISEADANALYLDSGNSAGIYDLTAFLLTMKS